MADKRTNSEERDRRVLDLYEKVLEIEQRLIPTGLHVFGRPSDEAEIADLLRMVASFDRPELDIRSLPDLVAEGLGLPRYATLLKESPDSEQRLRERERVEAIVRNAVALFVGDKSDAGREAAINLLSEPAAVSREPLLKVFEMLSRIREQLGTNYELDGLTRALRGEYVEPGPGADIIQNPGILPTGR